MTEQNREELEDLGFNKVEDLEDYIRELRKASAMASKGLGEVLVTDFEYDRYFALLKKINPNSAVFTENWEEDEGEPTELDVVLKEYGMKSIRTNRTLEELKEFKEDLADNSYDMLCTFKLNGHAFRAVYKNGELVEATTRGRKNNAVGRNITYHLKAIIPNTIAEWKNIDLVEIRGELLVRVSDFERVLSSKLKTPLASVTSLVRDSVTDEELSYLKAVCYKCIPYGENAIEFDTLASEIGTLERLGFEIPYGVLVRGVNANNLFSKCQQVIQFMQKKYEEDKVMDYDTDGVVMAVNSNEEFYSLGSYDNYWRGNVALKMGNKWGAEIYSGIIEEILYEPGKSYIVPKALIKPVRTVNGSTVTKVPLYNVGVMNKLHLLPNEKVYFKYGGETGVTLVTPYGESVKTL